jgi:hypothetical protein
MPSPSIVPGLEAALARTNRALPSSYRIAVGNRHEDQDAHDQGREAESRFYAVPLCGHPHAEPFTSNRDETNQPDQEAGGEADHGEIFGSGEGRRSWDRPEHPDRTNPAKNSRQHFRHDDQEVGYMMQRRARNGPVPDRGVRKTVSMDRT